MADTSSFSKFVPGFEFLENLVKNAGSALPSMGQWVVPTLDPEELDRRIKDLRTVQFWLDQNSRMLATTVQALEVQRMTLSALKGMNVTVNEMHEALKVRPTPSPASPSAPLAASAAPPAAAAESTAPAAVVDAMQWWGALTQQFTQLASQAMQAAGEVAAPAPVAKGSSSPAKEMGAASPGSGAASGTPKSAAAKRASATAGSPAGRKAR